MANRDGLRSSRYTDAVIPTSALEDSDGNRSNYMAWGLVQLPGRDREFSVYTTEAYYTGPGGRIQWSARTVLRRVRGPPRRAPKGGRELSLRPVRFQRRKLVVSTGPPQGRATSHVELLDAARDKPLSYAASDCRELRGDAVSATVAWTKGDDLERPRRLAGHIGFVLDDADVFFVSLRDEMGGSRWVAHA